MNTPKEKIKKKILSDDNYGKIWSAEDFPNLPRTSVLKALSDLSKEKVLKRAKRGYYHRLKITLLGESTFSDIDLAFSKIKNKCGFYCISGLSGFNGLGFTTQVPNVTTIACDMNFRSDKGIAYIYRKKPINGGATERIVMDAIIDIKTIPDTTIEKTINRIKFLINNKTVNLTSLVKSAFYESPRVKSVIGAIAEEFGFDKTILTKLKKSLNPLSMIYLNIGNSLVYANNWQIRAER